VLGHYADALVIVAVVIANAMLGTLQEGRAERSMAALRRMASLQARVLRDGRECILAARELVPGDVLLLASGDAVAADARLLDVAQLQVVEAALTGESVPVHKTQEVQSEATALADRRGMVWCGTFVTGGRARAVVVATGAHTEVGRIAGWTQAAQESRTPLELRLARFGQALLVASLGLFVLIVALGFLRSLPLGDVLMVAISQMVSVVPEGLPVAMTIALAVGMQRMAARGAIIRRLAAVETIGSTTVICTDKTGTLTRNEMTVVALWYDGWELAVDGSGYAPTGALRAGGEPVDVTDPRLGRLLQAAVLCNDAELLPPGDDRGAWSVLGDPTEGALLVVAAKAGVDPTALRHAAPRLGELPFEAEAKLMATAHRAPDGGDLVYVKGAPESVLRLTAGADGPLRTEAARAAAERLASRALRVLAFAMVERQALDPAGGFDALAGHARLLGLAGQIDPPRAEARLAVAKCRAAGIRPIMVTGDHRLTGLAIAQDLGIAGAADRAIDGVELERMGDADLHEALEHTAVFARVQPAQKLRIVEALQARGEVVAMTGDGVNDAPSLKQADVGVAMGIKGTEAAKEAAEMVLLDDNFASIVNAVHEGRTVYDNIRKVVSWTLPTNGGEALTVVAALVFGFLLPMSAAQILWINLVTSVTLGLALAFEPAEPGVMRRPPRSPDAPLLSRFLVWRVVLVSIVFAAVSLGVFFLALERGRDLETARTLVVNTLVVLEIFYLFNVRYLGMTSITLRGVLGTPAVLYALAAVVVAQLAFTYLPLMQGWFATRPVALADGVLIIACGVALLALFEGEKLLLRRLGFGVS
jgi:Ca2+-transporting ATPase